MQHQYNLFTGKRGMRKYNKVAPQCRWACGPVYEIRLFFIGRKQLSVKQFGQRWKLNLQQISNVTFTCACHTNRADHFHKAVHSHGRQVKPVKQRTEDSQLCQLRRHSWIAVQNKTSKGTVHCRSLLTNRAVYSAFTWAHDLHSPTV